MARYRKHRNKYRAGDFKVRSDESGLTVMNSDTRLDWKGNKVAKSEWEEKHPQLIIYPRQDKISVNNPRVTPEDDDELTFGEGDADDL